MSDFLATMAATSARRWALAEAREPLDALRARALATPPPRHPRPHPAFDLVAEVKLVAPSAGRLAAPADRTAFVVDQARRYAAAGACAISVLTEPERFDGDLADLAAVAAAVDVPAMRKDFLVHPGQVWEARAAGAGGVLLIARMLDDGALDGMLAAAREADLFVLLEAFDEADLARCRAAAASWPDGAPPLWVGVNVRDLATLRIDPARLAALAPHLPPGVRCVAESGLRTPEDARAARALGYDLALVGSALMQAPDATALAASLLAAGRAAAP